VSHVQKGAQVILLIAAYTLASWLLRASAWSPPALLSPESMQALARPFKRRPAAPKPGASPRAADLLVSPRGSSLAGLLAVPTSSAGASAGATKKAKPGSWEAFLERLGELEAGKRDKVRVIHLGDSELVADGTSGAIRRRLAQRFGLGGLGFSLVANPLPWYQREYWRHHDGVGFTVYSYVYGRQISGMYGPGGVAFDAPPGSHAFVTAKHPVSSACTIKLFYAYLPRGGVIELTLDGTYRASIDTERWRSGIGAWSHSFDSCPRELNLATRKRYTRLYGWSVEYAGRGIIWSSLGVVAARITQLVHYQPQHLREALAALEPDLVVLTFGLNLAALPWPPPPTYRNEALQMMRRVRSAVPNAACLVTGPYPVGYPKKDGSINPEARSAEVVGEYQRAAAEAVGCVFLDRFRLAGGKSAARRWVAAHPKILAGDYQHLTVEGSNRMGRAIAEVLLASYARKGVFASGADFALESQRQTQEAR